MEEGALNRYEIPLAINTALKLVREGRWTRPNRMPPNWREQPRSGRDLQRCITNKDLFGRYSD